MDRSALGAARVTVWSCRDEIPGGRATGWVRQMPCHGMVIWRHSQPPLPVVYLSTSSKTFETCYACRVQSVGPLIGQNSPKPPPYLQAGGEWRAAAQQHAAHCLVDEHARLLRARRLGLVQGHDHALPEEARPVLGKLAPVQAFMGEKNVE